ncbi:hypothetical protein BS47DRAFT_1370031, partial [Hydnum rufescens UP504]
DNGDNDALFYNPDERVDDEQDEGATSGQDEDIEDDADEEFVTSMMSALALITLHGGAESSEWKQEAQELVAEHKKLKSGFAKKVGLSPADIGSQLNSLKRRWMDDALSAAWMNIHVAAFLVSGHPDLAASKHNAVICGSPAMKQWIKAVFLPTSTLLPKIHSHILVAQGETGIHLTMAPKQLPPDMHGRWTACIAELTWIFEEQNDAAIGPKFPWSTIPAFLIQHHLYISGWPLKSEFPSVLGLIISSLRTEHWTNLWNRLFAVEEHKHLQTGMSILGNKNLLPLAMLGLQENRLGKRENDGRGKKYLGVDEDESPEPFVGGESPEPLVGGESLKDHQVSAPPEPLQSNMFAKFAPGTLFDPSLTKYNFDFNEQIHFNMNGLNPNEGTNLLDFVNPAGSRLERQVQTTTPVDAGVWSYEILAWFGDPNENLRAPH